MHITVAIFSRALAAATLVFSASVVAIPEGPEYPSAEWTLREAQNFARVGEAPIEQSTSPEFTLRWETQALTNFADWLARASADPSWLDPRSGNSPVTPLCTTWARNCAGDPFRYPGFDTFYENEGEVVPVIYYDAGCARISGRIWAPMGSEPGDNLPTVVVETGSVQAPEPLYWWMAQALVRAGYAVMTFDVRGQGRSDQQTPNGEQGSNANSTVFWDGLVNAIDFFRSTDINTYPHNVTCADTYPTETTPHNPFHDRMDHDRLGIVGHSLGATGISVVQSYGAEGADPWPGLIDDDNPVDVAVGWDSLRSSGGGGSPAVVPRVPAMGHSSEYGLTPTLFLQPPDPEGHKGAFSAWKEAGLPIFQLTIQGSSHYEWSLIPTFPTTSWCPDPSDGVCQDGWGRPLAEHYSLAWLDRWLKLPGEPGFEDADDRLLADANWVDRYSFYFRSARFFETREGVLQDCEDIRAGCPGNAVSNPPGAGAGGSAGTTDDDLALGGSSGGGGAPLAVLLLGLLMLARRAFNRAQ